MRCPSSTPGAVCGSLLVFLIVGTFLGCAGSSSPLVPLNAGAELSMEGDEGILIIQVDTDIPLASVDLGSGQVASNLPAGQHIWMTRSKAGRDRWERIFLGEGGGTSRRISTSGLDVRFDDEFEFDVQAGVVNYPGELIIRSNGWSGSRQWVVVRNRNHSAMAVRRLRDRYGAELDRLPIRYGGRSQDGFLDYYTGVRDRAAAGTPIRGEGQ